MINQFLDTLKTKVLALLLAFALATITGMFFQITGLKSDLVTADADKKVAEEKVAGLEDKLSTQNAMIEANKVDYESKLTQYKTYIATMPKATTRYETVKVKEFVGGDGECQEIKRLIDELAQIENEENLK